ncbi:MAG: MtrB/PioB family decaheme-associated outer membrane protein [Gammaproteobacteria bacterium]|nr:MtrB/PioB family decaheme-associated outer membrane protein [Gammaproteobacteria bacterium]
MAAAFAPAHAQDIGELTGPGSSVSVGIGAASGDEKDRARFGMFNGLRKHDYVGLFGFSLVNRDSSSGRWFSFEGRNLGLDNRELSFSYRQLGDFKVWADYGELVRHDPRTINTGLMGAGTANPAVAILGAPGTGQDLNLELKRRSFSINGEKWFGGTLQLEVNFKNEDKTGARFFGKGFACASVSAPGCGGPTAAATGWALLMLPEPVDSTIRQLDARLNWSNGRLNLSGGYYGSFYTNAYGNISPGVPAGLLNGAGTLLPLSAGLQAIMNMPVALWPDNQAQQVYLSGNYALTPKTKVNFKYSYTHATQNEDFLAMGLAGAPAGRSSLGGEVNITKAQVGFSARPLTNLHLHGDLKYDERNDKTPVALYNLEGANTFSNGQYSPKKLHGRLEANYRLPANFVVVGGLEHEKEDLGAFTQTVNVAGLSGLRQKLSETGYRLELKKMMSETLTGSISFKSSKREGDSPWLKPLSLACTGLGGLSNAGTGVIEADTGLASITTCATFNNGIGPSTPTSRPIFPFIFEDRKRDKVRLMANWTPTDRLDLTFFVEDGKDKYSHPSTDHGLRNTGMRMYTVDAAFAVSDAWKITGYLSRGEQTLNAGHSTGYDASIKDTNDTAGIGVTGKPGGRYQMGAELTYMNDKLTYTQLCDPACSVANAGILAASGGLPDVTYRLTRLRFFGEYAIDKTSYLRLDLIHQRTLFNEWTYNYNGVPFFYNDNTTLNAKQNQSATFVGASYVHRFR